MGNFFSWLVWFLAGALGFALSSQALIVKLSDLHTMARRSDIVIHGYVGEQTVIIDEKGRPITLTDVEVIDKLYGDVKPQEVIRIYQVGGKAEGIAAPIVGGQRYEVGQEVMFFGLRLDNTFVSFGAGQGKFDIHREANQEAVVEDLGTVGVVSNNGRHMVVNPPSPLSFSDAEIFKDEVRLMLKTSP
jgi:hypothetical protein